MFEGPLDLLLYLIRKQNLDILQIPIAKITNQYVTYIHAMQVLNIELASEYLLMAAVLLEIKSRILLPRPILYSGFFSLSAKYFLNFSTLGTIT